jgi:hypothetical protein
MGPLICVSSSGSEPIPSGLEALMGRKLNQDQVSDLLDILDDRHSVRSTSPASSIEKCHDLIGDPTLANVKMDRLVHNAYKIQLKGDS